MGKYVYNMHEEEGGRERKMETLERDRGREEPEVERGRE